MIIANLKICPVCRSNYTASVCPKCGHSESNQIGVRIDVEKTVAANSATTDTEPENAFTGPEKILHRDFITDMERRGAHCIHAHTHTQSTIGVGYPDVHVMFAGEDGICRSCAIEFKKAGGSLSESQRDVIKTMRRKNIPVLVAWTLADAIRFAKESLFIPDEK